MNCPRTLSNGDFLPFNGLLSKGNIILIDWGFGGVMPYSLDIARLIAHGSEGKVGFPFYMNDKLIRIFVEEVYKGLVNQPTWKQFQLDIKLSLLNEYIEFIERELLDESLHRDEFFVDYYEKAKIIASQINEIHNNREIIA